MWKPINLCLLLPRPICPLHPTSTPPGTPSCLLCPSPLFSLFSFPLFLFLSLLLLSFSLSVSVLTVQDMCFVLCILDVTLAYLETSHLSLVLLPTRRALLIQVLMYIFSPKQKLSYYVFINFLPRICHSFLVLLIQYHLRELQTWK
jgi:hypothetical protein